MKADRGCVFRIFKARGIELRGHRCKVNRKKRFAVTFKEQEIGTLLPDGIVDPLVIVATPVAAAFHESHTAQRAGYLSPADLRLGFLLNVTPAKWPWKRIVNGPSISVPSVVVPVRHRSIVCYRSAPVRG